MTKWYDKDGEHDQAISNADLARDLRDLRAVDKLMKEGKITQEQHRQALNIIRPPEGDEPGLGDMWDGNAECHCEKERKKRGRKSFKDLGE